MNDLFSNAKNWIFQHKIWSTLLLIILIFVGYKAYASTHSSATPTYVIGTVQNGSIIGTVSASGQVQASNQVDIQAKVSGAVTWVGVVPGQKVYAGQALASIDDTDAKQSIVDAQNSLNQSKLQLEEDSAQAPIAYQKDQQALATDQEALQNDYNNTFNDLSATYLDLPNVTATMQDTLYGYDLSSSKSQWNVDSLSNTFASYESAYENIKQFAGDAQADYTTANNGYTPALTAYKATSRTSATSTMEALLNQSITTTTSIAQALQSELNFLQQVSDTATNYNIKLPSEVTTLQNNARTALTTTNGDLSTLLADQKTIQSGEQTISDDEQTISLAQINNPTGSDPISLQISEANMQKQESDLQTQEDDLANYTITSPIAGTVSVVNAKVGDNVSGTIASVISNQEIAQLSLNEVDAAKVAIGDKATLTFDAVDGLSIAGTVAEVDPVGTVSQGVVTYNIQIAFDTSDPRVKPGMSVDAAIITSANQNVLIVPTSAIKTDAAGNSYVLVPATPLSAADLGSGGSNGITLATPPVEKIVLVGATNGTQTEITSGLTVGEQIITRTNTTSTGTAKTSAPSIIGGNGAGGNVRVFNGGGGFGGARIGG